MSDDIIQRLLETKPDGMSIAGRPALINPDGEDAVEEIERLRRERDEYRDMLKGIAININNMLKPVGNPSASA